jgi:UDP-N-acetylmuramoyl-tripeptide--D-alanyl-D-alanine ligase
VIYNEGNLNSETGLPLSVFRIRSDSQVGIFEMGMNRHDEIGEIAAVLRPQYAVITNIGTAHIGILGSRENIAAEKKKIFSYINASGAAIIPAADDFADFLASGVQGRVIRYGPNEPESGVAYVADKGFEGSLLKVDGEPVLLRLPGKYNYLNVLAAIALARCLDVTGAEIRSGIRMMAPLAGRGQISHVRLPPESGSSTVRTVTLFEDCYNANPDSLSKTLELCASVRNRKIYVLGDMLELGSVAVAAHAEAGVRAAESEKNTGGMLIFVGREMKTAAESAAKAGADRILYFPGCDDASIEKVAQSILDFTRDGDFILLKGSRGIGLERISGIIKGGSCG